MKVKIYSNIKGFGEKIDIQSGASIRELLTTILEELKDEIALIGIICVGKRIITNNIHLLKGRRHRKYFALKIGKKIYIKFGWHKIKNLTKQEEEFIQNNWHFYFFENEGKHLIEKSGGIFSPDNLLYSHNLFS